MFYNYLEKDKDFKSLIDLHQKALQKFLTNIKQGNLKDSIDQSTKAEIIELMKKLGLHYGHYSRSTKCDHSYIEGTENKLNIINVAASYDTLLKIIADLYRSITDQKNVLIVSRSSYNAFSQLVNFNNVKLITRWYPGTLTNAKQVQKVYKKSLYNASYGGLHTIVTFNANIMPITSQEVACYNNKSNSSKIKLFCFSDTNYKQYDDKNIETVILNDESPYYYCFLETTVTTLFDFILKK